MSSQVVETCWKCEQELQTSQKTMTCSTCKLEFHIKCVNVSEAKHDFLSSEGCDLFWFCKPCKRTTASVINHVANMEIRIQKIESEREREQKNLASMQNLVEKLQDEVEQLQSSITQTETDCKGQLESILFMVNQMLSEVPNSDTIIKRFENIEDHLEQCSCNFTEPRVKQSETSQANFEGFPHLLNKPDELQVAAISNELCERKKREKSFVIHNLPESNEEQDIQNVCEILQEILQKDVEPELDCNVLNKPRIYRIGRKMNNKVRTLKIHVQSTKMCEQILVNSRCLSGSKYNSVVVQKDLTLLERQQLKQLVREKRRRNDLAKSQGEEPDWKIRDGVLCRKNRSL